ncbi:MAG TPA: hypothetical protein VMM17_12325 [Gemmatimonadaceae bacterium]|nr:hypothetical protein [Gemmatimonadaceae bacterium]
MLAHESRQHAVEAKLQPLLLDGSLFAERTEGTLLRGDEYGLQERGGGSRQREPDQ